jgi:zinc protease
MEDRVELPRLYLSWLSPAMFESDDAELDLVADLVGQGKTSRLYRRLVYDRRLAMDVVAYQSSREMSGVFQLIATAAPGHTLTEIEEVITESLAELAEHGPTPAETERSLAETEAQFVYRLQTVGGFGGKSDQLNAYNVFRRDPGYFDLDRARYDQVTPLAMSQAVGKWITGAPRVALSVVPRGATHLALTDSAPVVAS